MPDKIFGADFTNDTNPVSTWTISVNNGTSLVDVTLGDLIKAIFPNGDYGDFSATSQVFTLDSGVVTLAKLAASILSGNGSKLGTVTGTLTQNKQLAFDANGNIIASASDIGSGSGATLTNSNSSPTTADVTLAVNTRYFVDASGLTADRALKFPAGSAGDQIEIRMIGEHASYACVLRGDTGINLEGLTATEWDRLWHSRMALSFVYRASDGWRVINDTRKYWRKIVLAADGVIDFTNIPSYGNDISVDAMLRSDAAATGDAVVSVLNNDTGANYYTVRPSIAHSATLTTAEQLGTGSPNVGTTTGNTAPAGSFGSFHMRIPAYSNTTVNKVMRTFGFAHIGVNTNNQIQRDGDAIWKSSNAIDRITLSPDTGTNFKAGSQAVLKLS